MLNLQTYSIHDGRSPVIFEPQAQCDALAPAYPMPELASQYVQGYRPCTLTSISGVKLHQQVQTLWLRFQVQTHVVGAFAPLSTGDKLRYAMTQLNATGSQLAAALDISRARVYQLLDGQNAGPDTTIRLDRLNWAAQTWSEMHTRPLGMILPKPKREVEALWSLLAQSNSLKSDIKESLERLSALHSTFEEKEGQRKWLSTGIEGMRAPLRPSAFADE